MARAEPTKMQKENIQKMEKRVQAKVSGCLSSLEVALAKWEASEKKPAELKERIELLVKCHSELSDWLDKSLRGDSDAIVGRLERFVSIMHHIEQSRGEG